MRRLTLASLCALFAAPMCLYAQVGVGGEVQAVMVPGGHPTALASAAGLSPLGIADTYITYEGRALTIEAPGPLANDLDLDGEAIILSNFFQPDNGTLTSIVTNGAFTYVPNPGFTGTDSFRYFVRDASGNLSEPVTVTILVIDPSATDPAACLDPATAPSYAGGYVLNAAQTRAFVRVDVPQGGTAFAFYNTSNLTVGMPEDAAENPLPGVSRTGDTFTFAPASAATVFFPIATAGSGAGVSFYLRVTDTCGRTVDVDPAFALDVVREADYVLSLDANAPNPFSDATTLRFTLAEAGHARLVLYDALGREVAVLRDVLMEAGPHGVRLDARTLPSGVYVYRLDTGGQILSRTLTVAH